MLQDSITAVPLDRFLDFLLATPSIFVDNRYATHVAEKLLLRLCRILAYTMGESGVSFTVYDPSSGGQVEMMYHKEDTTEFSALFSRILTAGHRKILQKVIGVLEKLVDSPEVGGLHGNVWTSVAGSVLVQVVDCLIGRLFD